MTKIIHANEYTAIPPKSERFEPSCYAWLTPEKQEPLHVKEMLPAGDREHLLRLWEDTEQKIAGQRYPDQEDFKNKERQMGKLLHSSELIKRLQRLNGNLVIEDSVALKSMGSVALYLMCEKDKKYTNASFRKGWVPEFTTMDTDRADLPSIYPTYGWRTVLVRLLKFGAISWQQVLDTFGDVHFSDSRGKHWNLNVKGFRT